MKRFVTFALVAAVSVAAAGCSMTELRYAADRAGEGADAALITAEWGICRAATVGSVLRHYGSSPERMAAWNALCLPEIQELGVQP